MNVEERSGVQDAMVNRETGENLLVNLNNYCTIIDYTFSILYLQHLLLIESCTLGLKKKTSYCISCHPRV